MVLLHFSLVLLSWVSFIYSVLLDNVAFEILENYFRIRQQQGT